jgi:hypothetical protein
MPARFAAAQVGGTRMCWPLLAAPGHAAPLFQCFSPASRAAASGRGWAGNTHQAGCLSRLASMHLSCPVGPPMPTSCPALPALPCPFCPTAGEYCPSYNPGGIGNTSASCLPRAARLADGTGCCYDSQCASRSCVVRPDTFFLEEFKSCACRNGAKTLRACLALP